MKPNKSIIICIEDNKSEAISVMKKTFAGEKNVEIRELPTSYPQGERKVLVYNVTGRIVPEGARLADVGVIVSNVTTIAVFAEYIDSGMPLVNKVVTVDGPAVKTPANVLAPIGTPIRELFDFCGGFLNEKTSAEMPKKIIIGGPMMGIAQPSLDVPVVKTTNCLLAYHESTTITPKETACIKCGRCITKCPINLMPPNIETAFSLKNFEKLEHFKVNMCLECGCCAYVCPSGRRLVQVMQLSKEMLWERKQAEKKAAEKAAEKAEIAASASAAPETATQKTPEKEAKQRGKP